MERLQTNAATLRSALAQEGLETGDGSTQIVPLVIGDAAQAVTICEAALARGVFAQAIRPPTVPDGTSRLRLAVMATHRERELRDAARTIASVVRAAGVPPLPVGGREEAEVEPATVVAGPFDVDAAPSVRRAA